MQLRDPDGSPQELCAKQRQPGGADINAPVPLHRVVSDGAETAGSRGKASVDASCFTATGGWGGAVVPGEGLVLDRLPAEWRGALRPLADGADGGQPGCITLPKLAAAAQRQNAATTVHDGKIGIGGFPDHVHMALKAFDTDGSGAIDAKELMGAAVLFEQSKKSERRMLRFAAGLLVAIIVVCSATAGLTYAVVEDAKEVRAAPAPTAEGQVLATVGAGAHKGEPLAVTQARIDLPLAALAYMPEEWANIHSVNLSVGGRRILRGVDGVDVSGRGENATTTLYGSVGDVITVRGLLDGAAALRDGTVHTFCGLCGTCGAFSVRSDRVVDQLADFRRGAERSYAQRVAARRAKPLQAECGCGVPGCYSACGDP